MHSHRDSLAFSSGLAGIHPLCFFDLICYFYYSLLYLNLVVFHFGWICKRNQIDKCEISLCSLCWTCRYMDELPHLNSFALTWEWKKKKSIHVSWITIWCFSFILIYESPLLFWSQTGRSTRLFVYCDWKIQILCSSMGYWDFWARYTVCMGNSCSFLSNGLTYVQDHFFFCTDWN